MEARATRIAKDEAARRLAQSEFEKPVVVVAGAGTGKTALLVARTVAWCVGPGWDLHAEKEMVARRVIEGVVAITFTEAAAAQMAQRIGEAFVELARGEKPIGWDPDPQQLPDDPKEVARRAAALADEGHRLAVSTIHAFCQRLLATHPLEAGLHPRFEVDADGSRLEALVDEVVEEALRALNDGSRSADWERLATEGVGPPRIAEAVRALVAAGVEAAELEEDPFDDAAAVVAAGRLRQGLAAFLAAIGRRLEVVSGPVSVLTRDDVARLASGMEEIADPPTFEDLATLGQELDDRVVPRLKKWARIDLTKSEGECFGDAAPSVAAASGDLAAVLEPLVDLSPAELAAARAVVAPLLEEVERRRSRLGIVTFGDQLRRADGLLEGSPGVRREVGAAIDQLLVDEFQDTDEVQCRIVEQIAFDGPTAERPGLFIVGDPKQSIYAWRSADLAAYDKFVERVKSRGGKVIHLIRNFRSVTPILDEVDRLVAPVMREEWGVQPPFEGLEATDERIDAPGFDLGPWRAIEHWVAWPDGEDGVGPERRGRERETTALEAETIAADIRRVHDEGEVKWKDIAVLLRVTTAQEELLEAFRLQGIPYEVARERDYYRQREVVELAALVRCVLEPTDVLALLTVLRADVVGVPDAALAPLWDEGFPACVARIHGPDPSALAEVRSAIDRAQAKTPTEGPGGGMLPRWPDALVAAVEIIAELRRALCQDPPDVFVELIRTLWLAEVTAGARFLGRFRRARLERFFADLEASLLLGDGGDAELARFLRRAVEEGRESRLPPEPDIDANAVHVMTIHGAKGLDFEHVYVSQIHKGGRGGGRGGEAEARRFEDKLEYSLFGWATPGLAAARRLQARKSRAELVRLLYVAATRAKQRLVISGGWGEPGQEVDPESAGVFADLLARRADPEAIAEQVEQGAERVDGEETAVQWVFPVFGRREKSPDRGSETQVAEGWSAARMQAVEELARARAAAAERMALPLVRAASEEAHRWFELAAAEEAEPAEAVMTGVRDAAMIVGSAVHALLETLDLELDLPAQVAARRDAIIVDVTRGLGETEAAAAAQRAGELLDQLASGACLERLAALASQMVARELPVLLWAEGSDEAPNAVVSGIVDLVYRDPDDGRLVVTDYKTDRVESDAELEERRRVYEPQVRTYARALSKALALDHEPYTELWFLGADRIIRLERTF